MRLELVEQLVILRSSCDRIVINRRRTCQLILRRWESCSYNSMCCLEGDAGKNPTSDRDEPNHATNNVSERDRRSSSGPI